MTDAIFTADFKCAPYWWDRTPRPQFAKAACPARADVVIIGSGYTGLCAAIETARAGRHTVVLDAADAGWGCSSRNGGLVSAGLKPGFAQLAREHGETAARAILGEGRNALAWIGDFVETEQLDCDFNVSGKFHGAHTPGQFEIIAAGIASQPAGLEVPAHVVPKSEQHREIATDAYHGGVVYENHAAVDPARYHQGLLNLAIAAEAEIIPHCRALAVESDGGGFLVSTPRADIRAGRVIVATNGYTDAVSPWMRRRVIPIGSYMIATEPLARGLTDRLLPGGRTVGDTRKVVYYYRASPDRRRIVFGGRVTGGETDPEKSAPLLLRDLVTLFPDLADVRVSHGWMGYVAYTFDHLPHIGVHDGIHYAMGYCGSGVAVASYLGSRIARQALGKAEGRTALDGLGFQTRPLYSGNPWFLSAMVACYRWLDRIAR